MNEITLAQLADLLKFFYNAEYSFSELLEKLDEGDWTQTFVITNEIIKPQKVLSLYSFKRGFLRDPVLVRLSYADKGAWKQNKQIVYGFLCLGDMTYQICPSVDTTEIFLE